MLISGLPMESVTGVNVHRWDGGLLVELVGVADEGEMAVRSFEFEWVDGERDRVRPAVSLPTDRLPLIADHLTAAGYEIVTDHGDGRAAARPSVS